MTRLMGSPKGHPLATLDRAADATAPPLGWTVDSPVLTRAYSLAESAHHSQRRATDRRPFLSHVTEVATLLHEEEFDDDLVAVGLLHDSVERGTLSEDHLRTEMGDDIASLVLALSEDDAIASFDERKQALRDQVRSAGGRAITVFAADKLSDIIGLRRGIEASRESVETRLGTSVAGMAAHYRESVTMIESATPESCFLSALRRQLAKLATEVGSPT